MNKVLLLVFGAVALAGAQDAKVYLGRWDVTVTPSSGNPYPQWIELVEKQGKIEGRVQPRGGGWRPILGATPGIRQDHDRSCLLATDVVPPSIGN